MSQYRTMENYHGDLEATSVSGDSPLSTTNSTAPKEIANGQQKADLLKSYPIVVVLVYATWCGPCTAFKPQYAAYAMNNASKAYFCQENADLRLSPGVRGIPTMVVYKGGNPIERITGADLARLEEILPPL
jgi:thioredoxin 1